MSVAQPGSAAAAAPPIATASAWRRVRPSLMLPLFMVVPWEGGIELPLAIAPWYSNESRDGLSVRRYVTGYKAGGRNVVLRIR